MTDKEQNCSDYTTDVKTNITSLGCIFFAAFGVSGFDSDCPGGRI